MDALIITALKDELDAVRAVNDGALESIWREHTDSSGFRYYSRNYASTQADERIQIALAQSVEMGGLSATQVAARLVNELRPRCLAMSGICAGRRGKVSLGDVIVADRVYGYDEGKIIVHEENKEGVQSQNVSTDLKTYNLDPRWRQAAERFRDEDLSRSLVQNRPVTLGTQEEWLLQRLYERQPGDPPLSQHEGRNSRCPRWKDVVTRLRNQQLITKRRLKLTKQGRAHIEELLLLHPDGLPGDKSFRIHIGPIATGSRVIEDGQIFDRLSKVARTILGTDMEAAAIGMVADVESVPWMIIVKGVQDHADSEKDDSFRDFAARASAEFLLAFLRRELPPQESESSPNRKHRILIGSPDMGSDVERVGELILESSTATHVAVNRMTGNVDALANKLETLGPDSYTVSAHNLQVAQELARIRHLRAVEPLDARRQVLQLVERVQNGDVQHADRPVRADLLHWASRLHASQAETLDDARCFREQLRQLVPEAHTQILDALILETEGDVQGALRMLRDADDPDSRSTFFTILHRNQGPAASLEWFEYKEKKYHRDLLTGLGWFNAVVAVAEADRWEEAADYLAETHEYQDEWPDLVYLEGVVNAALLLPSEFRRYALELNVFHSGMQTVEGPQSDQRRDRAFACFERVEELTGPIRRARQLAAQDWILWLRLTVPDPEVSQAARAEVQDRMKDGRKAVSLIPIAQAFSIPFDADQISEYLDQRARQGGLDNNEIHARFLLAEMRMSAKNFIMFLDENEALLNRALPRAWLAGKKIEALVKDGQTEKARELLERYRDEFEEDDCRRISMKIDANEGIDPRAELATLYERTDTLVDLQNFVNHLRQVEDWKALHPLLKELFQRERTLRNALKLFDCMDRQTDLDPTQILDFLEENQDLVDREPDLASAKARKLFEVGRLDQARAINDQLRSERDNLSDLQLAIDLALQSGDWELFPGIVEREWLRREEHKPETLLNLASLAAEADATANRAIELVRLGASKGCDNPHILVRAVGLSYRLGREEEETGRWLSQALSLSSENGPIKAVDLRTLVEEWMPAHQEQRRTIEEHLLQGTVPLHAAAAELNEPFSGLLIGRPWDNAHEPDGRLRTIIPIFSGSLQPVKIHPEWTIGLDVNSLMILAYLGLLRKSVDSFQQLVIAPETMVLLLNERNRTRFHQPSRIKAADEVRELIEGGQLQILEPLPKPPQVLAAEVGLHLAQLLQAAKDHQGRVVCPRPIHKLGSLMNEEAVLGEYEEFIMSTIDLERLLFEEGHLDTQTHEHAKPYLILHDHAESKPDADDVALFERPLYLADLALSYLQSASLLPTLASCGLDLRIHPSVRDEQSALIARRRQGERLAEAIEDIRIVLRDGLQSGKVKFLPRRQLTEEESRFFPLAPTLTQFLQDSGSCDAISSDDRYLNRQRSIIDRQGKTVPLVCILDILRHLENLGALGPRERLAALHKLRQSGFALVVVETDELKRYLMSVKWSEDGSFIESAELRVIRQTLARIRGLHLVQTPGEDIYLARLQNVSVWVIHQLWADESLSVERAAYLTDWVWRHVSASPPDWIEARIGSVDDIRNSLASHLFYLLVPMGSIERTRQEAFLGWVESRVLAPLSRANDGLVDILAQLAGRHIEECSKEIAGRQIEELSEEVEEGAVKFLVAKYLLDRQPQSIQSRLQSDEVFAKRFGVEAHPAVGIGGKLLVSQRDLFEAARRVLSLGKGERLTIMEGLEISISDSNGGILLHVKGMNTELVQVPFDELTILSTDPEDRLRVLDRVLEQLGPTAPDFSDLRKSAQERDVSDKEIGDLLEALWNGVAGAQEHIRAKLHDGAASLEDLMPDSLDYFERFCGPNLDGLAPEAYLRSALPNYRRALLLRDLRQGLAICLLGALRDDLCPGAWLEGVEDDDLWEALKVCRAEADPLSLLGALDIALYRLHDERFQSFADEAIGTLTEDKFLRQDGIDLYELLPLLAEVILNFINELQGGVQRAPFWRRMCAWMQATLAARLMGTLSLDLNLLKKIVAKALTKSGRYASITDLRREPMFAATQMAPAIFRGEVVGRLSLLRIRHQQSGRSVPRADRIDEAMGRLAKGGSLMGCVSPGPLEGHRRPEEEGRALPEELKGAVFPISDELLPTSLANLSQCYHLDEELRASLRAVVPRICLESEDQEVRLGKLIEAGMVAAAERDEELAGLIAAEVLTTASELKESGVANGLTALLVAGAAFKDESDWSEWLEKELFNYAGRLPAGSQSMALWYYLQELKKVVKLELGIHSRAEALASAAS